MSHTDFGQPDLAALRAAAGNAEFAEPEAGPVSSWRFPLTGTDPRARDLAAFGYRVARFGCGGAWLVTGRHRRGTRAGR
jgi:hypothetical protein